jgi:hypothetical protein
MSLQKHSAAGASAGFAYQFERALSWLAESPAGSMIGIETDDDVAVARADGSRLLEQDKHSIQEDAKPFGDRSKGLWNTLSTWIGALDSKEVDGETTRFLMVTNNALPDGIAQKISRAESEADIDDCVAALQSVAKNAPEHIKKLVPRVTRQESRKNLRTLISRCKLADGSKATAGKELRKVTISRLQLPAWCSELSDSILDELLGWLHKTVLESWTQGQPGWIQRDHFVNQLHAIINRRKREITRERAEYLIPVPADKIGEERARPFVKQLHLITDDDSLVDGSIREFVRCNIEKARLSAEGNVTDEDWLAFETALVSRWTKIRARVLRMRQALAEKDIGFEVFTDTTEQYCEKLAGSLTEQVYLTSGSYHRLADTIQLGWHPRFEELMRTTTQEQ